MGVVSVRGLAIAAILLSFMPSISLASGHYVHGYTRKDGTYVAPHYSRSPSSHSANHYSSSGLADYNSRHSKRDPAQRRSFMQEHPCPSTGKTYGACPGYVVDHVKPLKRGGADDPSNMQWQSVEEAKAKDKWE